MTCLPQLGSVPAAYAVVAGGCDWPLPPAVDLSNTDVNALCPLRNAHTRRVFFLPRATDVLPPSSPLPLPPLLSFPLPSLWK